MQLAEKTTSMTDGDGREDTGHASDGGEQRIDEDGLASLESNVERQE